jgi:hypothetical protein
MGYNPLFSLPKFCQEFFPTCDYYPITSNAYVEDLADKKTRMMLQFFYF